MEGRGWRVEGRGWRAEDGGWRMDREFEWGFKVKVEGRR